MLRNQELNAKDKIAEFAIVKCWNEFLIDNLKTTPYDCKLCNFIFCV